MELRVEAEAPLTSGRPAEFSQFVALPAVKLLLVEPAEDWGFLVSGLFPVGTRQQRQTKVRCQSR